MAVVKAAAAVMGIDGSVRHEYTLGCHDFALWFDSKYEDSFRWGSERGRLQYEQLRGKTIAFFRHTESEYQVASAQHPPGRMRHRPELADARLTPAGRLQAACMGTVVATALPRFVPDMIVSSPLARCLHTAVLTFPDVFLGR